MRKNFSIGALGAEIIVNDVAIDLHNLYNTVSMSTDLTGAALKLVFERDHQWKGPEGLPERVTLTCSDSLSIAFNDLSEAPVPLREDAVEIAYFGTHCGWDDFLDEELAAAHGFEGLHIRFSGGLILRIRSAVAEVTTA